MAIVKIPFNPPLTGNFIVKSGARGVILAHGAISQIDSGILEAIAWKLGEQNISSFRFNFPFRENKSKKPDEMNLLDQAYLAAWEYVQEAQPNIKWSVGGFDIGAETAIRISGLLFDVEEVPAVISINFPMYPPNRPELVNTNSLGALMGDGLFIQAQNSKMGTFDRMNNQVTMMAPHAQVSRIGNANQQMEVKGKSLNQVGYWISRDIEKFFKNIY